MVGQVSLSSSSNSFKIRSVYIRILYEFGWERMEWEWDGGVGDRMVESEAVINGRWAHLPILPFLPHHPFLHRTPHSNKPTHQVKYIQIWVGFDGVEMSPMGGTSGPKLIQDVWKLTNFQWTSWIFGPKVPSITASFFFGHFASKMHRKFIQFSRCKKCPKEAVMNMGFN